MRLKKFYQFEDVFSSIGNYQYLEHEIDLIQLARTYHYLKRFEAAIRSLINKHNNELYAMSALQNQHVKETQGRVMALENFLLMLDFSDRPAQIHELLPDLKTLAIENYQKYMSNKTLESYAKAVTYKLLFKALLNLNSN